MLDVVGGFQKLASAVSKGSHAVRLPGGAGPADPPGSAAAGDSDATLQAGIRSGLGLEPAVTLEGIASTLSRIYSAA